MLTMLMMMMAIAMAMKEQCRKKKQNKIYAGCLNEKLSGSNQLRFAQMEKKQQIQPQQLLLQQHQQQQPNNNNGGTRFPAESYLTEIKYH